MRNKVARRLRADAREIAQEGHGTNLYRTLKRAYNRSTSPPNTKDAFREISVAVHEALKPKKQLTKEERMARAKKKLLQAAKRLRKKAKREKEVKAKQ